MVIGNGLIGSCFNEEFENNNDVIIFASGVSNSKETKQSEFEREFNLVKKHISSKKLFVYFSTTSVLFFNKEKNPYVAHKLKIENFIKANSQNYLILRVSNLIGSRGNNTNIVNYLFNCINNNISFKLWENTTRNILGINDFKTIFLDIISDKTLRNQTLDIQNLKEITILEMTSQIERFLNKKANYSISKVKENNNKTPSQKYKIPAIILNKITNKNYFFSLLKKYYVKN